MADETAALLVALGLGGVLLLRSRAAKDASARDTHYAPGSGKPGTDYSSIPPGVTPPPPPPPSGGGGAASGGSTALANAVRNTQTALNDLRTSIDDRRTDLAAAARTTFLAAFPRLLTVDGRPGPATYSAALAFAVAAQEDRDSFSESVLRNATAAHWDYVADVVIDWLDDHETGVVSEPPVAQDTSAQIRRIQNALNVLRNGAFSTYAAALGQNWVRLAVDGRLGTQTYNAFDSLQSLLRGINPGSDISVQARTAINNILTRPPLRLQGAAAYAGTASALEALGMHLIFGTV